MLSQSAYYGDNEISILPLWRFWHFPLMTKLAFYTDDEIIILLWKQMIALKDAYSEMVQGLSRQMKYNKAMYFCF